jgi:hypothetical protein
MACTLGQPSLHRHGVEGLKERPRRSVLLVRFIGDPGAGWLACRRWARSALTWAMAARLPMRKQTLKRLNSRSL